MNISLQQKHHALNQACAIQLAEILREVDIDNLDTQTFRTTAAGDEQKMRGVPVIGRGITGAIPGTIPHADRWA
jgi:hypothetical protein